MAKKRLGHKTQIAELRCEEHGTIDEEEIKIADRSEGSVSPPRLEPVKFHSKHRRLVNSDVRVKETIVSSNCSEEELKIYEPK